jgi:hypothetical protein
MVNNLLGVRQPTSLLGDVRDDYIAKAKADRESGIIPEDARRLHPNESYFSAFMNFNKTDDDVIKPLVNLVMNQPDVPMSDIFTFPDVDMTAKQAIKAGVPSRKVNLQGLYRPGEDMIYLQRNPRSDDVSRGEEYKPMALKEPFATKIQNDFTAAHEMIHAALFRDVSDDIISQEDQHGFINYYLGKNLLKNKELWKEKHGDADYKLELANKIISSRPTSQFSLAMINSVKSMTESELEEAYEEILERSNPDYVKDMINFDKVKKLVGKPESKTTRKY